MRNCILVLKDEECAKYKGYNLKQSLKKSSTLAHINNFELITNYESTFKHGIIMPQNYLFMRHAFLSRLVL